MLALPLVIDSDPTTVRLVTLDRRRDLTLPYLIQSIKLALKHQPSIVGLPTGPWLETDIRIWWQRCMQLNPATAFFSVVDDANIKGIIQILERDGSASCLVIHCSDSFLDGSYQPQWPEGCELGSPVAHGCHGGQGDGGSGCCTATPSASAAGSSGGASRAGTRHNSVAANPGATPSTPAAGTSASASNAASRHDSLSGSSAAKATPEAKGKARAAPQQDTARARQGDGVDADAASDQGIDGSAHSGYAMEGVWL